MSEARVAVATRITPELAQALDRACSDGTRSRSLQLTHYLREGLRRDGYIEGEPIAGRVRFGEAT